MMLSLTPELKERIRKFRLANEINSEAAAIRRLLEEGLEAAERGARKKS